MSEVIPAEAVEAAAKVFEVGMWGRYDPEDVPRISNAVMEILEAAAPYIRAQVWEEGYTLGYADCANKQESNRPNPHKEEA